MAGISQTHDEMVHKIEEMTAVNEARMEMALGNVDQQKIKIEEEAETAAGQRTGEAVQGGDGPDLARAPAARRRRKTIGGTEAQKTGCDRSGT